MIRDKVSIERIDKLHPLIKCDVTKGIEQAENLLGTQTAIRIVQGLRTIQEQNDLYAIGRTKSGKKVTNAKGGSSFHNYGLAFDFAILYDKDNNGTFETLSWDMVADMDRDGQKDWMEVVNVFIALGFEWGGNWVSLKDNPHFQRTYGRSWQVLFAAVKNKKFIPGPEYVSV